MQFRPFVFDRAAQQIPITIVPMMRNDAELTNLPRAWQTSWTSEYLAEGRFEKYAAKAGTELVALGAYEILNNALVVHIVYMEAQPESNPNLDDEKPKYTGIGRLMIAYGIKLSIDNGFAGDVVLAAKTTEMARHYETEFGAVRLPTFDSSDPSYLVADEAAKRIFSLFCPDLVGAWMKFRKENPAFDAEWYCRKDPEGDRFYEIFFQMCRKYGVRWASADEKERQFIEEVTWVTYERERAVRRGLPLSNVRPAFAG